METNCLQRRLNLYGVNLLEYAVPYTFGMVVDLFLFGILTVQSYIYYEAFPNDKKFLKTAVMLLYLIGLVQITLATHDLYSLVTCRSCSHVEIQFDWFTVNVTGALGATITQFLYAHMIYIISRKLWLSGFIVSLSLTQLAFGFLSAVCDGWSHTCGIWWTTARQVWGPTTIACDVTITLSLSIFLLNHRRNTVQRRMQTHLVRIVQLIIQTGLAAVVLAILYTFGSLVNLASVATYYAPGLALGNVYSNSILALLNNRAEIVSGRNTCVNDWDTLSLGFRTSALQNETLEDTNGTGATSSVQIQLLESSPMLSNRNAIS